MNLTDNASFFIVYPLNLEDLGLIELEEKFKLHFPNDHFEIKEKVPGGVLIECPVITGLSLNKILRTPTRILIRLGEFKCRDAPKLFQKMSKFNWAPWMIGQTPIVESASTNSRLFDSRKIEKAIQDGVNQYYRHKPVKKKYLEYWQNYKNALLPKIYFRAVDDVCTISLDTTGERLHLRGEKILTGLAPIRESLAALLLIELGRHLENKENVTLIDPMCGSGTFLLEALDAKKITTEREFSFQHIPLVLDNTSKFTQLVSSANTRFKNLVGFDQNIEVVELAKKNCKDINIKIEQADLFDEEINPIQNSVVIMNPPYGIRVGEKSEINLAYYLKVIVASQKKFNPELLGIIIPADYRLSGKHNFKILSARPFKNGGIEVVFYVINSL
ncbi:MAG: N-6 DNA methylase [Bacteriovorax sp.]|jgi:putative N6-adenine-specific DNA methylase